MFTFMQRKLLASFSGGTEDLNSGIANNITCETVAPLGKFKSLKLLAINHIEFHYNQPTSLVKFQGER